MKRNKFDKHDSFEMGMNAELLFKNLCESNGWLVRKSRKEEDMNEHWDFLIKKDNIFLRIEVKAKKRISRQDKSAQDEWVWVELHGVRKKDAGWLYGKADLIAFEIENSFILVNRKKLIRFIRTYVYTKVTVNRAYEAKYKVYNRKGRFDKLTLVEMYKLRKIKEWEWRKI